MTAAGIAFIAGGLATLISLRSVLFGGGKRRERPATEQVKRAERRPALPAPDLTETATLEPVRVDPIAEERARPPEIPRARRRGTQDDRPGSLASIGLAAEEEEEHPDVEEVEAPSEPLVIIEAPSEPPLAVTPGEIGRASCRERV